MSDLFCPGLDTRRLQSMFGTEWRVVRAMPNTAVTVGEGACNVMYCTVLYYR